MKIEANLDSQKRSIDKAEFETKFENCPILSHLPSNKRKHHQGSTRHVFEIREPIRV